MLVVLEMIKHHIPYFWYICTVADGEGNIRLVDVISTNTYSAARLAKEHEMTDDEVLLSTHTRGSVSSYEETIKVWGETPTKPDDPRTLFLGREKTRWAPHIRCHQMELPID